MKKISRRVFAALTGLLMLTPAVAAAQPDQEVTTLKAMTFNIHHGAGVLDGLVNLERIARVISQSGADVIGLQEVDVHFDQRSGFADQAAWLADRLGLQYRFAANLDLPPLTEGQPRRQYGTVVLSRFPITEFTNTLLPLHPGSEQRGVAVATIDVDGRPVRFVNTHLSNASAAERQDQARKVVELLTGATTPTLVVGDLNAVPTSVEIKTLTAVWADTWAEKGLGFGFTSPSLLPTSRIDYVLHSAALRARSVSTPLTLGSDHLPVVGAFELG
ncbi:endonuclease/exonuclease/phosphatase family metal-dependent hydrolase [Kribbella amoyensis]|uniref:Endonuclease/exonuclease/phosphatase family metal-dependent hydrolase n=1 Tax=Kribbella amoyensis TaxID=996641 RepID=A0A561B837_9ACTN|nr:endonuclease/exonuclease/phosphatase family protein [Kribbella amoyensis]TWD75125.1 endonuclease/exonuclease/phosphatase family metal-dependent hydrolase [Kribbella amoyensis]